MRAEKACADGPISAEDLLGALQRSEQLDDFLESPAWEDHGNLLHANGSWEIGEKVGRYRLKEALALKLIRPDAFTREALAHFRAEQQALARLNHPHVAQFHEADLTEDGQPYFAMEWVDGRPIDQFFAARPPNLSERLRVFLDICAAVHHAHQKQVVHRDLKPSNILLREFEGQLQLGW